MELPGCHRIPDDRRSIVKTEDIDNFIAKVGAAYKEKIGYAADFYVVDIGDGAGVLK